MNHTIVCLLTVMAPAPLGAGEKGEPPDQSSLGGVVAAALRLRDQPGSRPPIATTIRFQGGDAVITHRVMEHVPETVKVRHVVNEMVPVQKEIAVVVDGRVEKRIQTHFQTIAREVTRDVTVHRAVVRELAERIPLKSAKAFVLGKEGGLEPIHGSRLPNLATKG